MKRHNFPAAPARLEQLFTNNCSYYHQQVALDFSNAKNVKYTLSTLMPYVMIKTPWS